MPAGDVQRRMTVVRLHTGKLAIYSAIALDEAETRALEDFGEPSYLIVPNDIADLNRIIVSHGSIVTRDPSGVLSHLAQALAA